MELRKYQAECKNYEQSLNTDFRREQGVFYTDYELASSIVKFLSLPKDSVIIDPCCGTGIFLTAAKELGHERLYGADIDKDALLLVKKSVDAQNVAALDTIGNEAKCILNKFNLSEPADAVVGNPPYAPIAKEITIDTSDYLFLRKVKDSGSNLFIAAIYRAFDLVKSDGIIAYIIPKNFLHVASYSVLRRVILNEKSIISIVDLGKYFKNVRGEQIVIILRNKRETENNISIYKYNSGNIVKKLEIPQSFYTDEILLFGAEEDFTIYKKLEGTYQRFSDVCTGYVGRGKSKSDEAIVGKDIRKFSFKDIDVPKKGNKLFIQNIYSAEAGIIASFAGDLEAAETVTVFTDSDEKMCRYILGFLHSNLCNYYLIKFCYNNSKLTMHTDAKYLKNLPLVVKENTFSKIISNVKALETIEYMSESWFDMLESLNDLVYKTYNISKNERIHIDMQMKRIQSKRWHSDK